MKVDWNTVLNSLIAAFIFSILGYAYQVLTGKVKISVLSYFKFLYNLIVVVFRWIFGNWQLIVGFLLLLAVSYGAFVFVHSIWAIIMTFSLTIAVILLTYYFMRHAVYKEGNALINESIILFSGDLGYFSDSPDGPWSKPVECNPLFPTWPKIEGAKWVWIKERPADQEAQQGQTVYHYIKFWLKQPLGNLLNANLTLAVDDYVSININGEFLKRVALTDRIVELPIARLIHQGENVVEMQIQNVAMPGKTGFDNPAGLIYRFDIG